MDRIIKLFTEEKQPELNKKFVVELWDGTKVYTVNGSAVRNTKTAEKINFTDFIGGGHCAEGDKTVPKGEIWIEEQKDPSDQMFILVHELTEYIQMKYYKEKYEHAHDIANSCEHAVRMMAEFSKKKIK